MAKKNFICPRCGQQFDVEYISVGDEALDFRWKLYRKYIPDSIDCHEVSQDMLIEDAIVPCIKCGTHIGTVRRVHGFRFKNKKTGEIYFNDID